MPGTRSTLRLRQVALVATELDPALDALGGDGGYMVICQTDDQAPFRQRAEGLGIRTAFEFDDHGYQGWQLHPGDTGGSFLEIDVQPPGECDPWMPAGPGWQQVRFRLV